MEKLSDKYRAVLKEEILYVVNKMHDSQNIEQKIFFFSAIYAMIQRIINLEYNGDLLFAHHVIQRTHEMYIQRLMAIKAGDMSVPFSEEHLIVLEKASMELVQALDKKSTLTSALKTFSIASYSTTGNGYYLMEKGMLKISN